MSKVKGLLVLIIDLLLLGLNLSRWHSAFGGWLFLGVYLFMTGRWGREVLTRRFGFASGILSGALGWFLSLTLFGFISGAIMFFYKFTPWSLLAALTLNALTLIVGAFWRSDKVKAEVLKQEEQPPGARLAILLYLALWVAGIFLLRHSLSGAALLSPWQTIDYRYIYVFFVATLTLGALIFSAAKTRVVLFLLVLHYFLALGYLPLTHQLFYGADGWRHLANERVLLSGQSFIAPTLSDAPAAAFKQLDVGQLAYAQLSGLSGAVAVLAGVDLITITKWLMPIVWALFFPLILYAIGLALGFKERWSLFLTWAGLLPFALQSGAFTLPNTLGLLTYLFLFLLLLKSARTPARGQLPVLVVLGALTLFGHSLYFILFWLSWLLAVIIKKFTIFNLQSSIFKFAGCFLLIVIFSLLIPALELITGYSVFTHVDWGGAARQIVGNFSGWYLSTGPRPHDILTGNILFNQIPAYAYVKNFFNAGLPLVIILNIGFLMLTFWGIIKSFASKNRNLILISILTLSLTFSYLVSRYFLGGDNILARRLDMVLAFLFIVLFIYSIFTIIHHLSFTFCSILIFVLSFAITLSYSLGPDTRAVSVFEYQAAQSVWEQTRADERRCVLADTYPLLALEAVSNKALIGGGFPIGADFSQPERERLYQIALNGITVEARAAALSLTGASRCFLLKNEPTGRITVEQF